MTRLLSESDLSAKSARNRKAWGVKNSQGGVKLPLPNPLDGSEQAELARKPSGKRQKALGAHGRAELMLPWPPSVNHYWRRNKGPGMHISAEGMDFRDSVHICCVGQPGIMGRVAVQVIAYPPDRRARDLDNILKALLDALQHGGVIESDALIDDLHISRSHVAKGGRVAVVITAL